MTDPLLTRLHAALAGALVERGHDDFDRPIRVLDIYEALIPYGVVRAPLGLALNADYEHALLRLLSGEGGLIRLEPAAARDELRREAESQNPRTSLFRKFAQSPVLVTPPSDPGARPAGKRPRSTGPAADPPPSKAPGTERIMSSPGPARATSDVITSDAVTFPFDPPGREGPPPDRTAPATGEAREERSEEPSFAGQPCSFCPETLPDDPRVRFCPYCGADQRLMPCERCGAVLERGWRYCISCGHEPGR